VIKYVVLLATIITGYSIVFQILLDTTSQMSLWETIFQLSVGSLVNGTTLQTLDIIVDITLGEVLVLIFSLICNVVLLNLLIAMMSNSYNKIEKRAKQVNDMNFASAVFAADQCKYLPPPFNLPFALLDLIVYLCRCMWNPTNTTTIDNMNSIKNNSTTNNKVIPLKGSCLRCLIDPTDSYYPTDRYPHQNYGICWRCLRIKKSTTQIAGYLSYGYFVIGICYLPFVVIVLCLEKVRDFFISDDSLASVLDLLEQTPQLEATSMQFSAEEAVDELEKNFMKLKNELTKEVT